MPKKQEIERHYFEKFQNDYPLPIGNIDYGDQPDVILKAKRQIGIEITNFYIEEGGLSESEQVQRKAREKVLVTPDFLASVLSFFVFAFHCVLCGFA